MNLSNRIYYNQRGDILFMTGEISNATEERIENEEIRYIDIPFGSYNYTSTIIKAVNVETGELITEIIDNKTEEQKRIEELEEAQAMLMMELALAKAGG